MTELSSMATGGRGNTGPGGNSPGNGHGIQLSTGELVVPMYGGPPSAYSASLCVSRDHGKSWRATPFSANVGDLSGKRDCCDEIEVAELPPPLHHPGVVMEPVAPTLYMTIRNDNCPNGVLCPGLESARQFSISTVSAMARSCS